MWRKKAWEKKWEERMIELRKGSVMVRGKLGKEGGVRMRGDGW